MHEILGSVPSTTGEITKHTTGGGGTLLAILLFSQEERYKHLLTGESHCLQMAVPSQPAAT